jgi:pseudouridine-5'-phosphate glycosidase
MVTIRPQVADAIAQGLPVVALESTLITHGLPRPANIETALASEEAVRTAGAVPATIGVLDGTPVVGLDRSEIERFASSPDVGKASRRDLAICMSQRRSAGTTVAATMFLAHLAGVRILATGGIGGVHRGAEKSFDISADLLELSQTPVAVVCAGAKSVLDIPKTLEMLETLAVPVIGFGTSIFPAFYVQSSGLPVQARFDTTIETAGFLELHWGLQGKGVLIAQPVQEKIALSAAEFESALREAEENLHVQGQAVTPALLGRLATLTGGRSIAANRELIVANARLAASIAVRLRKLHTAGETLPSNIA